MSDKDKEFERLRAIVETIVEVARPEKVILFGSRVKGGASAESDYDFLVVVRSVQNEREISRRIYRALLDRRAGAAVDLVVVDAGTLDRHRDNPFYVYSQALNEGKVFYEHGSV
jgi:predicted nucleotidyltransferase